LCKEGKGERGGKGKGGKGKGRKREREKMNIKTKTLSQNSCVILSEAKNLGGARWKILVKILIPARSFASLRMNFGIGS
jgi:hypothetical protein